MTLEKKSSNPIVAEAQELYEKDRTADSHNIAAMKDDLQFYLGGKDQWDGADLRIRSESNRPSLTTNMLPQFVHQVVNDIRSNVPSVKVMPDGDAADIETAKIIQGCFKNIEYISNAPIAYDTGAENQIKCGRGWLRIDHDYVDTYTFDDAPIQDMRICRVVNPLSVSIDSSSVEADGCDAKHGFVIDEYTPAEFKKLWPKAEPVSFIGQETRGEDDLVVVAEFFKVVMEDIEIVQLQDGTILKAAKAQQLGLTPVRSKTVKGKRVKRYRLSGADVLEETYFPGQYVPLIPVYGEEHWVDGKRHLISLIRHAKDPQRMINYYASLETELLQKAPQAPFMAAAGQLEGHEDDWKNPGAKMVLQYNGKDIDGNPVGAPQRTQPPPVPQGVTNARLTQIQNLRDSMGIQQAGLGQRSNETSGVAIQRKQHEGDVANMHFGDNLNRSICHLGRVYISMLPEVIDTPRLVSMMNEEDDIQQIGVNGHLTEGQTKIFDLTVGKYNVSVVAGPSFTTRRQETQDLLMKVMQTNPDLVKVMGDLAFKYSDMPGADVIAARLKKTIPPQLTAGEDSQEKIPAQAQQQIAQMQQQIQQDQAKLQAMTQQMTQIHQQNIELNIEMKNKQGEQQLKGKELEIKQGELQIKAAQAQSQAQLAAAQQAQAAQPAVEAPEPPDPKEDIKLHLDVKKQLFDQQMKEREFALKEDEMKLKVQQLRLQAIEAMQTKGGKLEGDSQPTGGEPEGAVLASLGDLDGDLQDMGAGIGQPKGHVAGKRQKEMEPVLGALGNIAQTLQQIHDKSNQPKTHQIVRDADGNMQAVVMQ
jgi:regulator of replication initiation timing